MKVTLVCLTLVALAAAAYAVHLPQLEEKKGWPRFRDGFPVPVYRPSFKREENEEDSRSLKLPWNNLLPTYPTYPKREEQAEVKRLLDGGELADLFLRLVPYLSRNRDEAVEEPKTEDGNAVSKRLLNGGELADLFLELAPYLQRNKNDAVEEQKGEEQNGKEHNGEEQNGEEKRVLEASEQKMEEKSLNDAVEEEKKEENEQEVEKKTPNEAKEEEKRNRRGQEY